MTSSDLPAMRNSVEEHFSDNDRVAGPGFIFNLDMGSCGGSVRVRQAQMTRDDTGYATPRASNQQRAVSTQDDFNTANHAMVLNQAMLTIAGLKKSESHADYNEALQEPIEDAPLLFTNRAQYSNRQTSYGSMMSSASHNRTMYVTVSGHPQMSSLTAPCSNRVFSGVTMASTAHSTSSVQGSLRLSAAEVAAGNRAIALLWEGGEESSPERNNQRS